MGRPQRIDIDGAWHHVMNRGAGHQRVFHVAADGTRFLNLVHEGCERTGIRVAAFCLMGNHYHLLANCPSGGLSSFMQRLSSMYTRYVNLRTDRDGPVFRSRFHSLLIDNQEYLDCAGRYIHRNPLDIQPPVQLDRYRWSSFQYYVEAEPAPPWLSTSELLDGHAGRAGYRTFVEGDNHGGVAPIPWAVDTALAETDDLPSGLAPHLRRTLMLAVLDQTGKREHAGLVVFPSTDARNAAMRRMRRRLAAEPALRPLVDRALRLAG